MGGVAHGSHFSCREEAEAGGTRVGCQHWLYNETLSQKVKFKYGKM